MSRPVAPGLRIRPVVLTTDRLVLREFTLADLPAMFEYHRHPDFLTYYEIDEADEPGVRRLIERFLIWQRDRPRFRYQLAMTLRQTGELVGNVGIRLDAPGSRIAELGYEVAPLHWGQGYATEGATAMLDFAFNRLLLRRIYSHCIAENVASARVLEKIGMQPEGRLRAAQEFKGRRWDILLFGILEEDRPSPRKSQ